MSEVARLENVVPTTSSFPSTDRGIRLFFLGRCPVEVRKRLSAGAVPYQAQHGKCSGVTLEPYPIVILNNSFSRPPSTGMNSVDTLWKMC